MDINVKGSTFQNSLIFKNTQSYISLYIHDTNTRLTPNDSIELNRNKLHSTKVAFNRFPYTKRFICDYCELTTIKIAPASVFMQTYLVSLNTTQHFDWLYMLPMNNMLRASCKTAQAK